MCVVQLFSVGKVSKKHKEILFCKNCAFASCYRSFYGRKSSRGWVSITFFYSSFFSHFFKNEYFNNSIYQRDFSIQFALRSHVNFAQSISELYSLEGTYMWLWGAIKFLVIRSICKWYLKLFQLNIHSQFCINSALNFKLGSYFLQKSLHMYIKYRVLQYRQAKSRYRFRAFVIVFHLKFWYFSNHNKGPFDMLRHH